MSYKIQPFDRSFDIVPIPPIIFWHFSNGSLCTNFLNNANKSSSASTPLEFLQIHFLGPTEYSTMIDRSH